MADAGFVQLAVATASRRTKARWCVGVDGEFPLAFFDFFFTLEEMARPTYLGEFELIVILVLIRLGEGAYGVPIAREIELQTGREVALGSVYAALERMEQKGFVSSSVGDPTPERGGRAKRFFNPTRKGLREVRETQRILTALWTGLPNLQTRKLG
jgi:PadR family transcriptional regulator